MVVPPTALFALGSVMLFSAFPIYALEVNPNSPCRSICAAAGAPPATTESSIVCLDSNYSSSTTGSQFQQCVECELGSTYADPKTGTSDILWGLYNLRYTLSACMFGVPVQIVSPSTPCQVSCTPLSPAIESGLGTNSSATDLSFCNVPNFNPGNIQTCVFCYGLLNEQKYLANFLQALDIACRDPPSSTNPFPVAASAIFNATTIQPPTTSSASASGSHHLQGTSLALAIALPIVFAFLFLVVTCVACFFSARRRRREMAARGKMRRAQEVWNDSPATPRATQFDWDQAGVNMQQIQGTRTTQTDSNGPQNNYREDVGQIQDHELHDRYFPPPPKLDTDGEDGVEVETAGYEQHQQYAGQELHSPDEGRAPFDIGVAHGESAVGDSKDSKKDWI